MMREAEDRLRSAGCPKINLQIRRTNADVIAFYASLGYVQDEVVSMGRHLEVDQAADA
jgi:ribosomal protein S18 acetylase RimI-like enzyme